MVSVKRSKGGSCLGGPFGAFWAGGSIIWNDRDDAGILEWGETILGAGAIAIGIVNAVFPGGREFSADRCAHWVNGATDTLANFSCEGDAARAFLVGALHDLPRMSEGFGQCDRNSSPR